MEINILWDITTPNKSLEGDIEGPHYFLQLLASSPLNQLLWELSVWQNGISRWTGQGYRLSKGVFEGLSTAGRVGKAPALKKRCHFVLVGFGMEAEINAVAPWRKDQGQGRQKGAEGNLNVPIVKLCSQNGTSSAIWSIKYKDKMSKKSIEGMF